MEVTSLKLSNELKKQVARDAAGLGVSTHTFMVAAIKQATQNAELRLAFFFTRLCGKEADHKDW
jgi:predicted transcriptional regulator